MFDTLFGTEPMLPHDDPSPAARAQALAQSRAAHPLGYSWPPGVAGLAVIPESEAFPLGYLAQVVERNLAILENHRALGTVGAEAASVTRLVADTLADADGALDHGLHIVAEHLWRGARGSAEAGGRPPTLEGYSRYFQKLPRPALVNAWLAPHADRDALFAWQRLAGPNVMDLQQIEAIPAEMPFAEADWEAALGEGGRSVGSMAAALRTGRVFLEDLSHLHGLRSNVSRGQYKHLYGTRALFVALDGTLRPVGIQVEPGGVVLRPQDGRAWEAARYLAQVAGAVQHEAVHHLGRTHLLMEAVGVTLRRELAPAHPLRILLDPHLAVTFVTNASIRSDLLAPGGTIDAVYAPEIDVTAGLARAGLDGLVLQDQAPPRCFAARGLSRSEVLPEHPYRDDLCRVWAEILEFVRGYVEIYYRSDAEVERDSELRAWLMALGDPLGGRLRGVRPVTTRAQLTELVAIVVNLATAQHAAVHYPQYDFLSFGPNAAGAAWAAMPELGGRPDLLSMAPPWDALLLRADTAYLLASIRYNRLGVYGRGAFRDDRVDVLVERFRSGLERAEAEMVRADMTRLLSYPYLRPSRIPASIHV